MAKDAGHDEGIELRDLDSWGEQAFFQMENGMPRADGKIC